MLTKFHLLINSAGVVGVVSVVEAVVVAIVAVGAVADVGVLPPFANFAAPVDDAVISGFGALLLLIVAALLVEIYKKKKNAIPDPDFLNKTTGDRIK
ncbi:Hypothetical predicted protein [Octopus vulgaris]|uniref:Uncharacterized protein n=1 Tax=Octopus vulgaris TaxID=6645 RepID=A0AA36FHA8_OCTVU|nr:Hypothetical predicted protein [Octopus vulgaris]